MLNKLLFKLHEMKAKRSKSEGECGTREPCCEDFTLRSGMFALRGHELATLGSFGLAS